MGRAANGQSTIYSGADGRWHGRVSMGLGPDGRPDRRHVTAGTERAVVAKVRALESTRSRSRVVAARPTTLEAWLEHWLTTIAGPSVRPKTLAGYRSAVNRHLIPRLGGHRIDRLTPEHLEAAYAAIGGSGLSAATVHQTHRTLRTALEQASQRGRIGVNPAAVARPPVLRPLLVDPLTVAECKAVFAVADEVSNGTRYVLALALGLRQGEALGLCWDDVELDLRRPGPARLSVRHQLQRLTWQHGCHPADPCRKHRAGACKERHGGGLLLVPPKSNAARRTVVIPAPLAAQLRAYRRAERKRRLASGRTHLVPDLVFPNRWGAPQDPRRDLQGWRELLELAGVRRVRLHDARHTAATLLLLAGTPTRTVMQSLGWAHANMADHYQHAVDALAVRAANQLADLLWDQRAAGAGETTTETSRPRRPGPPTLR